MRALRPRLFERRELLRAQQAERHAGRQPRLPAYHRYRPADRIKLFVRERPARGDDRKTQRAPRLRRAGLRDDRFRGEQPIFTGVGPVMGRLRAELTVLGAAAALRVHDRAKVEPAAAASFTYLGGGGA